MDYPKAEEESAMMQRWGQVTKQPTLKAVSNAEELLALRAEVDKIHVAPAVQNYILSIVRATRSLTEVKNSGTAVRQLNFGASPRASLALYQSGKAIAWLRGQDFLGPALIQEIAADVLRHRIGLTYEAEAQDLTADKIIADIIKQTPIPAL